MIIVVEDDADFREEITDFLMARGLSARGVADGNELDQAMAEQQVSLVVLDVMLQASGESGLEISQRLRRQAPEVGRVILTCLDQVEDHVRGLETGADAYLTKGGDLLVLEATLRNVLERRRMTEQTSAQVWRLDVIAWELITPGEKVVPLTSLERIFLYKLLGAPGGTVSRRDLMKIMGKRDTVHENRNLDNVIRRLRRKVEQKTGQTLPVVSAYGQGYSFCAKAEVLSKLGTPYL